MSTNNLIFVRVSSDGEVHHGKIPPTGSLGSLVTRLGAGEKIVFRATAESGQATLFSAAASWPGSTCKVYTTGILGALGDKDLERLGVWFKPPVVGTLVPRTVKYTFSGDGILRAESGNSVEEINLLALARRNASGAIVEHASHLIALRPNGAAKVSLAFEGALAPQSLSLTASFS